MLLTSQLCGGYSGVEQEREAKFLLILGKPDTRCLALGLLSGHGSIPPSVRPLWVMAHFPDCMVLMTVFASYGATRSLLAPALESILVVLILLVLAPVVLILPAPFPILFPVLLPAQLLMPALPAVAVLAPTLPVPPLLLVLLTLTLLVQTVLVQTHPRVGFPLA